MIIHVNLVICLLLLSLFFFLLLLFFFVQSNYCIISLSGLMHECIQTLSQRQILFVSHFEDEMTRDRSLRV